MVSVHLASIPPVSHPANADDSFVPLVSSTLLPQPCIESHARTSRQKNMLQASTKHTQQLIAAFNTCSDFRSRQLPQNGLTG